MDAAATFAQVTDVSLCAADRLQAAGRLRSWLDATVLALTVEVAETGGIPEVRLADAANLSGRSVMRELRRAGVVEQAPPLRVALADGDVSVDHVDAFGRALGNLDAALRPQLLDATDELVEIARAATPERFEKVLKQRVRDLLTEDDKEAILARQRAATRVRAWVDQTTGMWNIRGEFDPVTGLLLQTALDARHDQLFAQAVPATAPTDPLERAAHLRGLALADLWLHGGGAVRPEVVVVLRPDGVGGTGADWRLPIEVPRRVLEELVADPATVITPIVVVDDLVLHAPGQLNLGRTTRLANRAQRRALQAVHPTCMVDGCEVPFHRCEIHHIVWWRNGGSTDLANLGPVCDHHHDEVHQGHLDLPPPRARAA
jgi:hypothetical protein